MTQTAEAKLFWCLNGMCKHRGPYQLATPMVGYPQASRLGPGAKTDSPPLWWNFHWDCLPADSPR